MIEDASSGLAEQVFNPPPPPGTKKKKFARPPPALSLVQYEEVETTKDGKRGCAVWVVRFIQWVVARKEGHVIRLDPNGRVVLRNLVSEQQLNPKRWFPDPIILVPNTGIRQQRVDGEREQAPDTALRLRRMFETALRNRGGGEGRPAPDAPFAECAFCSSPADLDLSLIRGSSSSASGSSGSSSASSVSSSSSSSSVVPEAQEGRAKGPYQSVFECAICLQVYHRVCCDAMLRETRGNAGRPRSSVERPSLFSDAAICVLCADYFSSRNGTTTALDL